MQGADYFIETPIDKCSPKGYVLRYISFAQQNPTKIAAEFNALRSYLISSNCKSKAHRVFGHQAPVMTRKFVIATTKGYHNRDHDRDQVSEGLESPNESTSQKSSSSTSSADILREQFERNWNNFNGQPWKLKSGVIVDDIIYHCVCSMSKQSSLHSGVIDSRDFHQYIQIFNPEDQLEISEVLNDAFVPQREYILEDWRYKVMDYFESPASVEDVFRKGWDNIFTLGDIEPEGCLEFCRFMYNCMSDVFRFYKEYGQEREKGQEYELKRDLPERVYMKLWNAILKALWIDSSVIKFDEGDATSSASTYRRNGVRSIEDTQSRGHKIDAIIWALKANTEFGAVEGGKKNEASYGTKYLNDSVKTAKTLKDMFDIACVNAARHGHDIKCDMEAYGIVTSGLRIEIVILKYLKGRLFYFKRNFVDELPPILNKTTLWTIKGIL
ncbi:hypothetical protein BGZ76_004902, partial [Entomortierella beljakovae]